MGSELVVIAHNAHEMATAQAELQAWADGKAGECLATRAEITEGLETARRNGWATAALKKAATLAQKQHEFYRKIAAASRLGYVVVPNFPVDVFAIRTNKGRPVRGTNKYAWSDHEQKSEGPAIGEGAYVSSLPMVIQDTYVEKIVEGKEIRRNYSWAEAFKEVAFPITAVKPQVLDDTARAMAAEVFDEIGIAPQGSMRRKHFDPMVLGRVVYGPKRRVVSFLVAWWLSSKDLEL